MSAGEVKPRWVRIDDRRLRNTTKSDATCEARTFGLGGAKWPRICVTVRIDYGEVGYRVGWSLKAGPGEWWNDKVPLPREVLIALPGMITDFLARTSK